MSYSIVTNHPIAETSLDHIFPKGVKNDKGGPKYLWTGSYNPFVDDVVKHFRQDNLPVLDLGASSGYLVNDFLVKGCDVVGIEGSDWPIINKAIHWETWHNIRLFNADISKPFQLLKDNTPASFKLINAWEVVEHLHPDGLNTFTENVYNHLDDDGIFVMSVSPWFEPADLKDNTYINLHQSHEIKLRSEWKLIFHKFEFFGTIREKHGSAYHYIFDNRYRGKVRGPEGKKHTFWSTLRKKNVGLIYR